MRRYRPALATKRVPSEKLRDDLEEGELTGVTLTKAKIFYTGVGADKLVKRQEEKIVLRTSPADKKTVAAFLIGLAAKAKQEKFEDITFHLDKLPGGLTNNPTIALDTHDALEELYVRAQRLADFAELLEAAYSDICPAIEEKMTDLVNSGGW